METLTAFDGLIIIGPFAALVAIIAIGFACKGLVK
jgi:hypothetical protein